MKQLHRPIRIFIFSTLAAGLLLIACTPGISGVETTNGFTLTATANTIEGTAPAYSTVYLFDTGYIPYIDSGFGFGTAVTANENFSFPLSSGSYNIFVYTSSGELAGMVQEINVAEDSGNRQQTMEKTTSITGTVSLPENSTALVYIPGSNFYKVLATSGPFSLDGIPGGTYQLAIARLSGTYSPLQVVQTVKVTVSENRIYDSGSFTIN